MSAPGEAILSGFERDPELDPIVAPPASAAAPAPSRQGPRVEPAEPRLWEVSQDLLFPLRVDGERIERLTIRRLTGQQVAELVLEDDDGVSLNARARARMAGVHPAVIAAMAADDALIFAELCRPLLPAALARLEEAVMADAAGAI
ncbi:hypothetical protein SAMN05428997_10310 [Bosea sp. CRIB-10]|uniref:phage tail assembly protein n=1 Tax=Bosea sp. CRIB-10 TaxID=378404 RepID=UPI0008F36DCB|nr:phage tail assembly protein [Bosea sp. CRIB-10]SFB92491.1 hypothetical protein SAMN05428997_10310 [Bosea sp. CRIB-10]